MVSESEILYDHLADERKVWHALAKDFAKAWCYGTISSIMTLLHIDMPEYLSRSRCGMDIAPADFMNHVKLTQ